jgi:hypothetical protein
MSNLFFYICPINNKAMYNTAIKYLQTKYPPTYQRYTQGFQSKLGMARNAKERKEIEASVTENDIIRFTVDLTKVEGVDHDDLELYLLLGQYNYGVQPKKELEAKLIRMNLVVSN